VGPHAPRIFAPIVLILLVVYTISFVVLSYAGFSPGTNTKLYHSADGMVCDDCHLTHPGGAVPPSGSLLKNPAVTDLCLRCHRAPANAAYRAPAVMTADGAPSGGTALPAGDFYWSSVDPKKGHNPGKSRGAPSSLLPSDPVLAAAPGGRFPAEDFDCVSCHDPHDRFGGKVAAWRQLKRRVNGIVHTGNETAAKGVETGGGSEGPTAAGYEPLLSNSRGDVQGIDYVNARKDGNPLEGADLFKAEGDGNKNVYRGGFSSFCSACHGDFHGGAETRTDDNGRTRAAGGWVRHPANLAMNETGTRYGIAAYTAAVINAQGINPNPAGYDWRYPLVKAETDFSVKSGVPSANDPATAAGTDRIACLTCHRAHASPYANMTRWDVRAHSFLAAGGRDFTGAVAPGDNPAYGCGKCHRMGGSAAYRRAF
jgi:predicted CXXCH cytochrome family protein